MATIAAYDDAAATVRRATSATVRDDRELIRLATLAASSHNTQPWRFRVSDGAIAILPDRSRRCAVVDPDDAHLYRSLGCAAENLVHAASLQGYAATVRYDEAVDAVEVALAPAPGSPPTELAGALTTRQCTRTAYDPAPVSDEDLAAMERAGTGRGVRCRLFTDRAAIDEVTTFVELGDRLQLTDGAFRRELLDWVRFNPGAALRTGDGLAGRVNQQPPLPTIVGRVLAPVLIRAAAQAKVDRERLRSSAGVAIFLVDTETPEDWVEVGRAYERFALRADLLDIRSAFVNQPVEVPELRSRLGSRLGIEGHAQLIVRFGRGARAPYSLRRPVDEVLVA
jgi:hypothetical protein